MGSNPGGGEIFHSCPDRPWGPPSLLHIGHRAIPGGGDGTVALITHPYVAPRLKKEQSYTATPLWAFVACSGVKLPSPLSEINLLSFWSCIFCLRLPFLHFFLPPSPSSPSTSLLGQVCNMRSL